MILSGTDRLKKNLWTTFLSYAPKTAFDLAFKEELKVFFKALIEPEGNFGLIFLAKFLAGIVATGSSTIICYPLDFARTRLAVDLGRESKEFKGLWDLFRKTVTNHGVSGLYSGLLVCLYGDILYRGLKYGLYDGFKKGWIFNFFLAKFWILCYEIIFPALFLRNPLKPSLRSTRKIL